MSDSEYKVHPHGGGEKLSKFITQGFLVGGAVLCGIMVYGAYQSMGSKSIKNTKPMGMRIASQFLIAGAGISYFVYQSVKHGGIRDWISGKTTSDIQRQLAVHPKKTMKEADE